LLSEAFIVSNRPHGCEKCRTNPYDALEQVGKSDRVNYFGGKDQDITTHYKCKECGAKWRQMVQSGVGGHHTGPWEPDE